jgi:hypothetical protein
MASTIKLKNGSGAPTTGDLVQGEPALDLTNKRLYTENASGVVIEVGTNPSTIDINAGTIDGTVIGGSTAAAGTFTTGQFNTSLNVDGTVTADGLTVDGSIATIQNTSDGTALRLSSTQNSAHSLTTPFGEVQFYSGDTSSPGAGVRASIGGYPFDTAASGGGVIKLQTSDSASLKTRLDISNNGDISFYEDSGTTAKFFWDASAESLGIGNSAPTQTLEVTGGIRATVTPSNTVQASLLLANAATTSAANLQLNTSGGLSVWSYESGGAGWFNSATIDSSGNLLVGQTSADSNSVGIGLLSNGTAYAVRDGGAAFIAHRKSSDGNIVEFLKDNTTVGSIGSHVNGLLIGTTEGSDAFLKFESNAIRPATEAGGYRDGAIDLGYSASRFKDLYLSGGVYLGGTGAANLLDDYEEGTFTPTYTTSGTDFSSITYDIQEGYYTKVGNMVNVRGFIRTDSITVGSASGDVRISNLPFSAQNNRSCAQLFSFAFAGDHPNAGQVSLTNIGLVYQTSANGTNDNNLAVADMGIGANDNGIIFSLSYQVA